MRIGMTGRGPVRKQETLKRRAVPSDDGSMTASPGLSRLHVPGYPPPAPAARPWLYEEIEEQLTALLGAPDSLVLPTITHIHMSVIPVLAAEGTVFMDARAH